MTNSRISRLLTLLHSHPRRALVATFLFVMVAGALGGPVAGALEAEGGFTSSDSESAQAEQRLELATGRNSSPGIVLIVDTPSVSDDLAVPDAVEVLSALDGVASAGSGGRSEDESSALVTGTLLADADSSEVAQDVVDAFENVDGVVVGGPAVAGLQLGEQVGKDLSRAELLAFPLLVLLSILIFGGRGVLLPLVVGITTVVGTALALAGINQVYGLSVFALNLTPREREVLSLVGRGMSNHEIAEHLVLSPLTAKTHVSRLFLKLEARDRAQLVVTAFQTGLATTT